MINETRTFELFGYISNQLKPSARKKIIRTCDKCGKEDIMKFGEYNRGNKNLCQSCAQQKRRKLPKPKFVLEQDRFIPGTGIDRILTIEKFGYDPIDLKEKSGRKVVVICQNCGKIRDNLFHFYRDLCVSCAISKSSKGVPKSEKCKNNMRKNHPHLCGKDSPGWKGGVSNLDQPHLTPINQCIQLNKRFIGSAGHHIMKGVVIFIPKDLHKSIYHNMKSGQGINEINKLALNYLLGDFNGIN